VGDHAAGRDQRILAQLRIRIDTGERAARIVEIEPAFPLCGIVQRVAERRKVGITARLCIVIGRGNKGRLFCDGGRYGHAGTPEMK
jgi:hypothetical protein